MKVRLRAVNSFYEMKVYEVQKCILFTPWVSEPRVLRSIIGRAIRIWNTD